MPSTRAAALIALLDNIQVIDCEDDFDGQGDRVAVAEATRRLLARLETPFERAWRLSWINGNTHMAVQVIMDVGIWEAWYLSKQREISLVELHALARTPCDLRLIRRLFRLLAAENVIRELGEDQFGATAFSDALGQTNEPVAQTILSGTHHGLDSTRKFPDFLAQTAYAEPLDPTNSCYMDLTPERLGMFERCRANSEYQASFTGFMRGLTAYKLDWTEIYDTKIIMSDFDTNSEAPLFVDIGGAHGVDVERLLRRYPELPSGKLILQDTPEVLALAKVSEKITVLAHDFFTPQPIRGARAYFTHAILHDWDDSDAGRILNQTAVAMKKGYSKLLLYETVLVSKGASLYQSVSDVSLMHLISAADRTETRWRELLRKAGFEVLKIWQHPSSLESIIEAELA
ncbi:putative O-methyltransferase [Xylaria bambusicola]|uniref:putative O-methyltransferase n=1 Tax=Xylaria bambusicola TaxID=326684 RepID=UPI002007DFD0|nr:putative O-methyltransferase [Xylaria bambusicola]KAI0521332.1 putative O-methyltransferase [Xylaria bambusicola]